MIYISAARNSIPKTMEVKFLRKKIGDLKKNDLIRIYHCDSRCY